MRGLPFLMVLSVTSSACVSGPTKPAPQPDADRVDPDAPAAETWASRHSRGTSTHAATNVALDPHAIDVPTGAQQVAIVERVDVSDGLTALVARAKAAPSTSDTPTERAPGVVIIMSPRDDTTPALVAFSTAGFVAIVPFSQHAGEFFGEVDDAKSSARFLASDPDVDVDHLYAFGDGRVACQLALDPDSPFRAVGALGATTTSTFADLPAIDEQIARALLPHAAEVSTRLVVYVADANDKAALAAHVRNPKIEIDSAPNAFTAFRQLIDKDSTTSRPVALRLVSSRSAL